MKKLLLLVALAAMNGCAGNFYVKAGLGWNGNAGNSGTEWIGDDQVGGRLAAGWRRSISPRMNIDLNVYHHSQPWLHGEDPETTSEHVYFDIEFLIP